MKKELREEKKEEEEVPKNYNSAFMSLEEGRLPSSFPTSFSLSLLARMVEEERPHPKSLKVAPSHT